MSTQTTHCISINGKPYQVDETIDLKEVKQGRPQFFSYPHGSREVYKMHRGFLVVRNTNCFGGQTMRSTTVYAVAVSPGAYAGCIRKVNTQCVCSLPQGETIRESEKRIDTIITAGNVDTY